MGATFRRGGIYCRRWQWWYPWGVTRPWLPRAFRGGDEWCNDSVALVLPPLGGICVFWRPGPLRAMPCPAEWESMDDAQQAGYAPCGTYHGGRLNPGAHDHLDGPCEEARKWLETARPA